MIVWLWYWTHCHFRRLSYCPVGVLGFSRLPYKVPKVIKRNGPWHCQPRNIAQTTNHPPELERETLCSTLLGPIVNLCTHETVLLKLNLGPCHQQFYWQTTLSWQTLMIKDKATREPLFPIPVRYSQPCSPLLGKRMKRYSHILLCYHHPPQKDLHSIPIYVAD